MPICTIDAQDGSALFAKAAAAMFKIDARPMGDRP
jgi:hypothetical protein